MQPLFLSTASLQGSLVTPKSTLLPSLPDCGAVDSLARHPVASRVRARGTASAATMRRRMVIGPPFLTFAAVSIGERPCLPIVAYSNPYPEQASRFEEQENDDQQPVEDLLGKLHGDPLAGGVVVDERQHRLELRGNPRQQRDEQ